jgi:3-phenylpropionate/trans-cinnamate dioxygenase ferredoxin reductase subunit
MSRVIIIGGGQAGSSLVAKLRSEGFEGQVTLIANESLPPYQRPPLSKGYLLGEMNKGCCQTNLNTRKKHIKSIIMRHRN